MAFFKFNNRGESDKRVRLVPKSPDATIKGNNGEDVDFLSFGEDGYGFCLGKADAVSDYFLSNLYPLDPTVENVNVSLKINNILMTVQPFPEEDIASFSAAMDDVILFDKVKYSSIALDEAISQFNMTMDDVVLKDVVKYSSLQIDLAAMSSYKVTMDDVVLRDKAIVNEVEVQKVSVSMKMNNVVRS